MKLIDEGNDADFLQAAGECDYWWTCYCKTGNILTGADALVRLSNAMSDLRTYLQGYDPDTGTLEWERVEDVELSEQEGIEAALGDKRELKAPPLCSKCQGRGNYGILYTHPTNPVMSSWDTVVCPQCNGTGNG